MNPEKPLNSPQYWSDSKVLRAMRGVCQYLLEVISAIQKREEADRELLTKYQDTCLAKATSGSRSATWYLREFDHVGWFSLPLPDPERGSLRHLIVAIDAISDLLMASINDIDDRSWRATRKEIMAASVRSVWLHLDDISYRVWQEGRSFGRRVPLMMW